MLTSPAVEHIDAVDAFARTLYLRAKQSGLAFTDVASAVRQLHLALRHLRVEATDPDSLLNQGTAPIYSRKLRVLVEDCDFSLAQLESFLNKYGDGRPSGDEKSRDERIAAIRSQLQSDKTNFDLFLDTIQLHNAPDRPHQVVNGDKVGLENIKDKVDQIASKLFKRRDINSLADDEDGLWLEFRSELEKEGFAPQVLRKHKDILRAYIRELESVAHMHGNSFPTVRGLLEREANSKPQNVTRDVPRARKSNTFPIVIHDENRGRHYNLANPALSSSPEEAHSDLGRSTALISTKDLMTMDNLESDMNNLRLQPPGQRQHGVLPSPSRQRYLAADVPGSLPGPGASGPANQYLGTSPRNVPPMAGSWNGTQAAYGSSPRNPSRLAPDRYGKEIPPDAQWTRIKRTLVSPEVLERAGVRYEARPEFVAILGRLSKEQIAEYARQSAACRAARDGRAHPHRSGDRDHRGRGDSSSSRDDVDDDSDLFDESDCTDYDDDKTSEKGTKSYPVIVDPPNKTSPASTVQPKPILKKKENHVRFDTEPHEIDPKGTRSLKDEDCSDRRRDRTGSSSRRGDRERSRRYSDSTDRYRGDRGGEYYGSNRRNHQWTKRDERASRKKAWGETLGAVGIGGAAVSLLTVLAEAAAAV